MRPHEFTLTEDHFKLMRRMFVQWDDGAYDGAPAIGLKRPYGNSDVVGDVIEILGWPDPYNTEPYEDRSEELIERALAVHRETEIALQIVLSNQSFTPGRYVKTASYDDLSWRLA